MKLLFTCVGRRVELMQAFRCAAQKENISLEIYGADSSSTAPALFYCDHKVIVPRISAEEYIPMLLRVCSENIIDAVVPTIDTDLLLLSQKRDLFASVGTRVIVSSIDKIALCRDKRLTSAYFQSIGLASPNTANLLEEYCGGFPAFIKPKDGSSSIFAYRVNNRAELEMYASQVPDYIIQPYVEGLEYTVDVFCDFDGNPIYITPRVRLAVRSGEVLKTKITQDELIVKEILQLLHDYRPCGAITVQLIRQKETGIDYFIEINPRYGGGAPLSIKAGADSPCAMLRLLRGDSLTYQARAAEDGAIYSRFDQSIRVQ